MDANRFKQKQRRKRAWRVRNRIRRARTVRPRLSVFRSLKHVYAQVIDDASGRTLVAASSLEKTLRAELKGKCGNVDAARRVGALVAERAKEAGLTEVAFDRGGYKYHGRVRALAEAARKGGLKF